jgi:hypothetical protein
LPLERAVAHSCAAAFSFPATSDLRPPTSDLRPRFVHSTRRHQQRDRILHPQQDSATSPERTFTVQQMGRYLDYCSELLSLLGKVAALFPQRFDDLIVLEAASDIETMTIGLSRKVWQKITMLQSSSA